MSLENHPNFHAVGFMADLVRIYFKALRGNAQKDMPDELHKLFSGFVSDVETVVDKNAED